MDGVEIEPSGLTIEAMKASMGVEDARPESGQWALQIGDDPSTEDNTTDELQHDCTPAALSGGIAALTDVYHRVLTDYFAGAAA